MSKHGRANKQHGPEPPAGVYTKPPPPVHGNSSTYNGRAHHHHYQQQQQQSSSQQQQSSNVVGGARPSSNSYHHHSLPRNAWSADRHSPTADGSSSNSSNERTYTANRRAKHHRMYNSHRQTSRTLQHKIGGSGGTGGATTDPDALSSVTTAGVMYNQQQLHHHQSQHQLGHQNRSQTATVWPSEPSVVHYQQQQQQQQQQQKSAMTSTTAAAAHYLSAPPPSSTQNAGGLPTSAAHGGSLQQVLRHHHHHHHHHQQQQQQQQQQSSAAAVLLPSCDVAVDACGGHCPRFENFCHFCLLVFYFSGITVGFLLIMAAVVSTRDPRFLYIGGLVLPVSAFLMAVQCRVRREADRRKRHRQLNSRYHHHRSNAGAAVMVINNGGGTGGSQPNAATATAVNAAVETIPLQNITAAGENTLRRQFQGNVYQYVGQRDNESNNYNANSHHYETASEIQQIEGVPWWRREDNRPYHSGRAHHP